MIGKFRYLLMFTLLFGVALIGYFPLNTLSIFVNLDGLVDKHENSILEVYWYKYRNVEHGKLYSVDEYVVDDSRVVVLAFPLADVTKGYFVLLANPKGPEKIKFMPDEDFILAEKEYQEIKRSGIVMSDEVDAFLLLHTIRR